MKDIMGIILKVVGIFLLAFFGTINFNVKIINFIFRLEVYFNEKDC